MMATLYIEPIHESGEILRLVQSAIESEVAKLELALKMAVKRLAPFEEKYLTVRPNLEVNPRLR
jgi:hypothetical protein